MNLDGYIVWRWGAIRPVYQSKDYEKAREVQNDLATKHPGAKWYILEVISEKGGKE